MTDLPEVVHVVPDSFYKLKTTRTWDYLGLSATNPNNLLNEANMGEEIIIGIIDTGMSVYFYISSLLIADFSILVLLLIPLLSVSI